MPIIRSVHKASLAVCTAELAYLQVRIISKLEYTMLSSDFSKLFRTSVKPVHRYHLCTGFKEALSNFGRSEDDIY